MYLKFRTVGYLTQLQSAISDPFAPHKDRVAAAESAISNLHETLFDLGLKLELVDNKSNLSLKIHLEGQDFGNDLVNLYDYLRELPPCLKKETI